MGAGVRSECGVCSSSWRQQSDWISPCTAIRDLRCSMRVSRMIKLTSPQVIADPAKLQIGGLKGTLFGWSHWRYYSLAHVGFRFVHRYWVSAHGFLPSLSDPATTLKLDELIDNAQRYKSAPETFHIDASPVVASPATIAPAHTMSAATLPSATATTTTTTPAPAATRKQSISESVLNWVDTTAAHGAERIFNSG